MTRQAVSVRKNAPQPAPPARNVDAEGDHLAHHRDHWLDEVTEPSHPVFNPATHLAFSTFAGPARLLRRVRAFAATTPGQLFGVTVLLTLAIAAAGLSMSNSAATRQQNLDVLLSTTEPMSNSAHNLYTSLSLADTVASTGFVQAGVESDDIRNRYNQAIDRAAVAATESVLGTSPDDQRIRDLVGFIQRELPVYTSMVESARVNHRMGNPVAAAYMSNASALMREQILPAASELFTLTSAKVSQEQSSLTAPQWVPLSGLVAAVFFLLLAQWWLWRLTRRRLNRGFVAATALLVTAVFWVSVSSIATWSAGSQAFADASRPWDSLTTSRIAAQQARTEETLALIRRQSTTEEAQPFESTVSQVAGAIDDYENSPAIDAADSTARSEVVERARATLADWDIAHQQFEQLLDDGSYDQAIYQATATQPNPGAAPTTASAFEALDQAMSKLIADSRESMRSYISEGLAAMTLVSTAVLLLTIAAVFSVWLGIRPRLQEYL